MGKAIIVRAWCDPHGEAADVEATYTDVPVRWGKITVTLDLCAEHYKLADDVMGPLVKVGKREGKINTGSRRGRRPREYYVALRAWLKAKHGIELEANDEGKYDYPEDLRKQNDAELEAGGGPDGVG